MRHGTTKFSFQQVDVFSSRALLGNPLAVVIGADSLTASEMAAFASWTNLSETTFLLQPKSADADYRVRIFTPVAELLFAGHRCHVWLSSGGQPKSGDIIQECEAGLIRIRRDKKRLAFEAPELR
ncbi:MAG: PhzF family phenazine biosynthesis protein, partial [Mesorhizobium sp.]